MSDTEQGKRFQPLPLYLMLQYLYGTRSTEREDPESDHVDIAATRLLAYNPMRVGFLLCNLSGNAIYVAPRRTVSATRGIFIPPNGGSLSLVWDRDFELCTREWWGTAAADASAVYVLENLNQ